MVQTTSCFLRNQILFTPTQIEAVRAGMQPGLTMVVGPPGTGKTDVAVQIISCLYHNYPDQRTIIVTHSNQVRPKFNMLLQLVIRSPLISPRHHQNVTAEFVLHSPSSFNV